MREDPTCSEILDRVLSRFPDSSSIRGVEYRGLYPEMEPRDVWFTWHGIDFRLTPSLGGIVVHEIVGGRERTDTPISILIYHILKEG